MIFIVCGEQIVIVLKRGSRAFFSISQHSMIVCREQVSVCVRLLSTILSTFYAVT